MKKNKSFHKKLSDLRNNKNTCHSHKSKPNNIYISIIIPPVVCHNLDPHTGIPFMPHMAGYFASVLDKIGYRVQIIDCFGLQPNQREIVDEFMLMGTNESWTVEHINENTSIAYIYCRSMSELIAVERISSRIKKDRPDIKICLFENIQAVTSFSLRHVAIDLIKKANIDAAIMGEPEQRAELITESLLGNLPLKKVPGIAFLNNKKCIITKDALFNTSLDEIPFPLWERFPLKGYWIAGFAHAPKERDRFLPLLTSRGCSYRCKFCISPEINPKWRSRSAINVVDEMEYFYKNMKISEFHISDLNPTLNEKRIKDICLEIIRRDLPVIWKLAQGTKIETIRNEETLELMAKAGCNFIAFSPESGSDRMLKIMNKPFNYEHALKMVKKMNELGIHSQACFIGGVPGELEEDRKKTIKYATKLINAGVDEISLYIFTPVPGSALSKSIEGFTHYSQCTPSPTWRKDYNIILNFRYRMYLNYFLRKIYQPKKVLIIIKGIITGRYKNKMEMSLVKQIKLYILRYFPLIFKKIDASAYLASLDPYKN